MVQIWRNKRHMKLIGNLHTEKIVEAEKKNRKCETTTKPEINTIKFIRGVDRADQILHYHPCYRKPVKWTKIFAFFSLNMAALNSFILLKKYTTNPNQKGKGYAFKGSVVDCVQEMTDKTRKTARTTMASLDTNSTDITATQTTAGEGCSWPYSGWTQNL